MMKICTGAVLMRFHSLHEEKYIVRRAVLNTVYIKVKLTEKLFRRVCTVYINKTVREAASTCNLDRLH